MKLVNSQNRLALLVSVFALGLIAHALYMPTKAMAAQILLKIAWQRSLASGEVTRPWPWADTQSIARIHFVSQDESFIVLTGSMGRTLAFAPGHLNGSSLPHENGHIVISGHRDTHFRLLEYIKPGERVILETIDGNKHIFKTTHSRIVDTRKEMLTLDQTRHQLTLITCYPFDAIQAGGPLRMRLDAVIET